MESNELTVVIVTFKSEDKIFSCLDSIPTNVTVIVVENSNDSNFKYLIENKYSYMPRTSLKAVFSTIYKRFDKLDGALDFSLGVEYLSKEYWNNIPTPNSSALITTPSLGYLFNTKKGVLSVSLQKPIFIEGSFNVNEGELDQRTGVWQLVLSFRSMATKIIN